MTNGFVPKVPEENRIVDWVQVNTKTVSIQDIVNDTYRVDTYIALVSDKISEAKEKMIRDWLISQGWTPPKADHEEV